MTNPSQSDFCQEKIDYQNYLLEDDHSFDSSIDDLVEIVLQRANAYAGPYPNCRSSFARIITTIMRSALTIEAISGMIVQHVNEQIRTIKIKTISAVLSLVKSEKPHLTIDIIEHVFGLSKDKETDIARKHEIDRQVVSKRVVKMRNEFGLSSKRKIEISNIYRQNRLNQYEKAREKIKEIKQK